MVDEPKKTLAEAFPPKGTKLEGEDLVVDVSSQARRAGSLYSGALDKEYKRRVDENTVARNMIRTMQVLSIHEQNGEQLYLGFTPGVPALAPMSLLSLYRESDPGGQDGHRPVRLDKKLAAPLGDLCKLLKRQKIVPSTADAGEIYNRSMLAMNRLLERMRETEAVPSLMTKDGAIVPLVSKRGKVVPGREKIVLSKESQGDHVTQVYADYGRAPKLSELLKPKPR